jgi:hypothetical protein
MARHQRNFSTPCAAVFTSVLLAAAFGLLPGCASMSPSRFVSPRVTGRVLDSQTHQPIKDVQVRRLTADTNPRPMDAPHGGKLLEQSSAIRTAADGTFVIKSVRTLTPFGDFGWYSISLAFDRAGYASIVKSFTLANSTNTPAGEPWVNAGDVLLPQQAE